MIDFDKENFYPSTNSAVRRVNTTPRLRTSVPSVEWGSPLHVAYHQVFVKIEWNRVARDFTQLRISAVGNQVVPRGKCIAISR